MRRRSAFTFVRCILWHHDCKHICKPCAGLHLGRPVVTIALPLTAECKALLAPSRRPGAGGEANREAFESAMKTVDVTFQNLDSSEISLTDVRAGAVHASLCRMWSFVC